MTRSPLVALLPLKAHSARVPGKNFRPFNGKPLVRWILDTLLSVERVAQIVINTDARRELSAVGIGDTDRVLLRDRKAEICGDDVSMNLVLADDVAAVPADTYLMTHTTNPLLSKAAIENALDAFGKAKDPVDSLFAVNKYQTRFYRADGSPVNHDPDNLIPTQELEPWFEENSNLYLFTADSFSRTKARIGRHPMMFETPKIESTDIDTEEDWIVAEALAMALEQKGHGQ